jgi:hypothetical protein
MAIANRTTDAEESALALAVEHKTKAIEALALAAQARKARGADTTGIEESLQHEDLTRAGYQRALDNRRRELRIGLDEARAATRGTR